MLFRREGLEELEAREKVRVGDAPGAADGVDGRCVEDDHRSPQGAVLLPERLRLGQVGAVVEQHKLLRHRGRVDPSPPFLLYIYIVYIHTHIYALYICIYIAAQAAAAPRTC